MTESQIRLISRLTKNITVIFDGDSAGSRAALRGIDIILEQGMNVKICTLPDGEDPDSFSSQKSSPEIKEYIKENSTDFIVFKASILLDKSNKDPVNKAEVINDIIGSISKISDPIKREVYIKECSKIMEISEQVLYSSLAQMLNKNYKSGKTINIDYDKSISVVKSPKINNNIDTLFELEKKIIEILLIYGNEEITFEEDVFDENKEGKTKTTNKKRTLKVFEKVYMDLHIDEMEFSNEDFKNIYFKIIESFNENKEINIDKFINQLEENQQLEVTNIVMENEKYFLHDWKKNNIYPKSKLDSISQLTVETILNLRCFLIEKKVDEFKDQSANTNDSKKSILEEVVNYANLKKLLSEKLNRVL